MTALAQTAPAQKSEKAFRSIGEAASELGLQAHVLRFWETKFRQLTPVKRADGRRMYRPDDMHVLRALQILLHDQGLTIKGAQKLLKSHGIDEILSGDIHLTSAVMPVDPENVSIPAPSENPVRRLQKSVHEAAEAGVFTASDDGAKDRLEGLLDDLNDVKVRLDAALLGNAA